MGRAQVGLSYVTRKADFFVTEEAEDAVVELHVSAVALVHLSQYTHQFCPSLGGVGALQLVRRQLVERALPGAADSLVLALGHPGNRPVGREFKKNDTESCFSRQ